MPDDWHQVIGEQACAGQILLIRKFGKPSHLQPGDRVELVLEHPMAVMNVALNGRDIGLRPSPDQPARLAITELLQPRNELTIAIDLTPNASGTLDQTEAPTVRLEIF